MTPLPSALGGTEIHAWRLDRRRHAKTWESGEGAFLYGGRWNGVGIRAVYCSLDPATAILEVAVHKGFHVLDTEPHDLIRLRVDDPAAVHVVEPGDVPNPNWLRPGIPGAGQQGFGGDLLARHPLVLFPSAVSTHSWNLVFVAASAVGRYSHVATEPFALDTRLNPARPTP